MVWRVNLSATESSAVEPPGFDAVLASSLATREGEDSTLATRRREQELAQKQGYAWQLAKSPVGAVPMMLFMMWMSGSGVQIFSIMITLTNVANPLRAILSSGETFSRFAEPGVDVTLPRLLFCAVHFGTVLFALYKLDKMGLLPTHASDWLPVSPPLATLETSASGLPL